MLRNGFRRLAHRTNNRNRLVLEVALSWRDGIKTRVSAPGIITRYTNNASGDLEGFGYSDANMPGVSFTYDRQGRPLTVTRGSDTTTLAFNEAGQILSDYFNGLAVTNAYDSLARSSGALPLKAVVSWFSL